MSEEFAYGVQGATAGVALGSALSFTPLGPIGAALGFLAGRSARKKRKQVARARDTATATQLVSGAYETGRVSRFQAATDRAMYAAGGVSTRSGSAAEMERGVMVESIYQQEALLAGLPQKHHWWKNPMRHIEMRDPGKHYRPQALDSVSV